MSTTTPIPHIDPNLLEQEIRCNKYDNTLPPDFMWRLCSDVAKCQEGIADNLARLQAKNLSNFLANDTIANGSALKGIINTKRK